MLNEKQMRTTPTKRSEQIPVRKLAPVLGRNFTDVILAKRMGTKFIWDSADPQADLKSRNAPIASELPPSFEPLVKNWRQRGGIISPLPRA